MAWLALKQLQLSSLQKNVAVPYYCRRKRVGVRAKLIVTNDNDREVNRDARAVNDIPHITE